MLTSIFETLCAHLSQLHLPVYLADCVPEGAALPYVTAEIAPPLVPGEKGRLTLTLWQQGSAANAERLSQADVLLTLLPPRGAWLSGDAGALILTGEDAARCLQSGPLLGVQARWALYFIPAA